MTITELLNLIRQCNLAQVRAELEDMERRAKSEAGGGYVARAHFDRETIQRFYENAFRQPK